MMRKILLSAPVILLATQGVSQVDNDTIQSILDSLSQGSSLEIAKGSCFLSIQSQGIEQTAGCIRIRESGCDAEYGECMTNEFHAFSSGAPIEVVYEIGQHSINGELANKHTDRCYVTTVGAKYFCFDLLPFETNPLEGSN